MATSFLSEHSIEFIIVPRMKSILSSKYQHVIALYPWMGREFSNISKQIHQNDIFKILAIFPRRPKVSKNDFNEIYITINSTLFDYKKLALEFGIETIAAFSNINNFWDLKHDSNLHFLKLDHQLSNSYLISVHELITDRSDWLLGEAKILELMERSKTHDLLSFQDFIRRQRTRRPYFMFGGNYKPIYLLIKA